MATKSTRPASVGKAKKPRPDFPLFPHASGRWAKKVKGKLVYFGSTATDPRGDAALTIWNDEKDDIYATGRRAAPKTDAPTVGRIVNAFLDARAVDVQTGELSQRAWLDYKAVSARMIDTFGRHRPLADLRPEDFTAWREKLAKTLGLVTIGNVVRRSKVVLTWAYEEELIDAPVRTGKRFKRPSKKARRRIRQQAGPKLFTADELRALIDAAGVTLRALILLGINTGMGNTDLATMPQSAVNLKTGWHEHGRPKTGVERRAPLWPETIAAIQEALAKRPDARDEADGDLVFLTKQGRRFVRQPVQGKSAAWIDAIGQEFKKLLKEAGINRPGVGFYSLRRTFRTVADASRDQVAIAYVMGHSDDDNDMGATYRQSAPDDERLRAVVECVRAWLFASQDGAA